MPAKLVAGAVLSLALAGGCGYIGEPMNPLLNIPAPVADLSAVERGPEIILQFTPPRLTTEGVALKKPARIELRVGPSVGGPFNADQWAANAKLLEVPSQAETVNLEIPAADWIGKEVFFGVKAIGENGRDAGWSNFAIVTVLPPLAPVAQLHAEAVSTGVRLTWDSTAGAFRVFRRSEKEETPVPVATSDRPEWIDTATEYGKTYRYSVQAIAKTANKDVESPMSGEFAITPKDAFAPAIPAGLTAVTGTESIELSWERNSEPDFAVYRVYRSIGDAPLERIAETEAPTYSDRKVESGKVYRYAISAVDKAGNESQKTQTVEAGAT
jgi:hypothetical protein